MAFGKLKSWFVFGKCFPAKTLVLALAGIIVPAVWAADVTVPAGETLTITDFAAVSYGGVDCADSDVITLNAGCTIKVAAGAANAGTFLQHVKLLGDATLDLTDYNAEKPFRLSRSIYTASPDTFKLTVVQGTDKRFWVGSSGNYATYSYSPSPYKCAISKGALVLPTDADLHFINGVVLHRFPSEIEHISYELDTSVATSSEACQPSIIAMGTDVFGTDTKALVVTNFQLVVKNGAVNSNQTILVTKSGRGSSWGAGHFIKGYSFSLTGPKTISTPPSSSIVSNNIQLAGGSLYARGSTPYYAGKISGKGTIQTMGWGRTSICGESWPRQMSPVRSVSAGAGSALRIRQSRNRSRRSRFPTTITSVDLITAAATATTSICRGATRSRPMCRSRPLPHRRSRTTLAARSTSTGSRRLTSGR